MTIKRVEFTYKKQNLKRDPATGKYIGYQVDIVGGGKRHRPTFATRADAQRFMDTFRQRQVYNKAGLTYANLQPVRLSELLDRRLDLIPHPKEQMRARRVFPAFRAIFENDPLVTEIRAAHFQMFINERSRTVKLETVNREVTLLRTAFSRASEMFPEALEGFEPPRIPRPRFKSRRRERIITGDEYKIIIRHLTTPVDGENEKQAANRLRIARFWQIGWYLGLRYGEIEALQKSDYNGERLRVYRSKTKDVTYFEDMPDEVHAVIREAIEASETDHLFSINGAPPKYFYQISRKAAESAGLKWGLNDPDSVTFHSLRHSFVTRLIEVTDLATAKSFTAHSDETMVALYSHTSRAKKAKALNAMYGTSTEKLTAIYNQVRSGNMTLEEFLKALQ